MLPLASSAQPGCGQRAPCKVWGGGGAAAWHAPVSRNFLMPVQFHPVPTCAVLPAAAPVQPEHPRSYHCLGWAALTSLDPSREQHSPADVLPHAQRGLELARQQCSDLWAAKCGWLLVYAAAACQDNRLPPARAAAELERLTPPARGARGCCQPSGWLTCTGSGRAWRPCCRCWLCSRSAALTAGGATSAGTTRRHSPVSEQPQQARQQVPNGEDEARTMLVRSVSYRKKGQTAHHHTAVGGHTSIRRAYTSSGRASSSRQGMKRGGEGARSEPCRHAIQPNGMKCICVGGLLWGINGASHWLLLLDGVPLRQLLTSKQPTGGGPWRRYKGWESGGRFWNRKAAGVEGCEPASRNGRLQSRAGRSADEEAPGKRDQMLVSRDNRRSRAIKRGGRGENRCSGAGPQARCLQLNRSAQRLEAQTSRQDEKTTG